MTPLKAIHQFCVECVGSPYEVKECGGSKCLNGGCDDQGVCWFYPYRLGSGRPSVKLIRKMCLFCMGGDKDFVRECWTPECALHSFRMGKNPNIVLTEEEVRRRVSILRRENNPEMAGRFVT